MTLLCLCTPNSLFKQKTISQVRIENRTQFPVQNKMLSHHLLSVVIFDGFYIS